GIKDLDVPANNFDITRPLHIWSYALINPVPTVTMSSPTNNAYILAPAHVPLRANATDNDGTIVRVEYYEYFEDFKIGEATAAPYTLIWSNKTEGTYGVCAGGDQRGDESPGAARARTVFAIGFNHWRSRALAHRSSVRRHRALGHFSLQPAELRCANECPE